jgi:GntR family transcriptional regulator
MDAQSPGLAAYQRVVEAIKADIRAGTLKPGDRLPGNRSLAESYSVSLGTAQKALRVLQGEGWLIAQPAVGVFVNDVSDHQQVTPRTVHQQLDELVAQVADLAHRLERLEDRVDRR